MPLPGRVSGAGRARGSPPRQAFGKILLDLGEEATSAMAERHGDHLARRDGLDQSGRVGEPAGLFRRRDTRATCSATRKIPSAAEMDRAAGAGQHIELGIAENNLFLNLAGARPGRRRCSASGCCPIGTVYDPFIARGLDALNYACYQDARFMLVATPSGLTLGARGRGAPVDRTPR